MNPSLHLRCGATLVAAALSFSSATSFAEEVSDAASAPQQRPIAVIAHRGGALLRPENTMPAFRHAAEIRAEYLEFDMEMTADDRVVVYHDALINRSEEHTSELQSLMRISYAVFRLKKQNDREQT